MKGTVLIIICILAFIVELYFNVLKGVLIYNNPVIGEEGKTAYQILRKCAQNPRLCDGEGHQNGR